MYITIAIPFYNAEDYLLEAIRSVFAQTYKEWELILIDDGSTDNSLKIANSIKDARVSVYSDGKNKRLAVRLNEVTKLAQYDFIARMDADDLMSPFRLEKQMEIFKANEDLDLVTCGNFSISNDTEIMGVRHHLSTSIDLAGLLNKKGSGVLHAAILARKKWFERNTYNVNLKTAQDYELWVRSAAKNDFKVFLMAEPLYYYREEGNVTSEKLLRAYKSERILFRKYATYNKFKLINKSILKTVIVRFLAVINKTDVLLRSRNNVINDKSKGIYKKDLEIIKNTLIPGIDL
ncbi:glycosyltransferase family 2 protein [Polaribacter sp. IC066]|uniref:glycosyltransferase family 2 protein n=1 Tax=Polaribacter sp. IC066 TaxID=57032 RepID=UPI0011BDEC73|nr:glycosyltransferase family 2 protein [Polaribacter sp. IC066]TXD56688.1 glycosyltransferase family 2 protein [Polaribacter sp. IC066]